MKFIRKTILASACAAGIIATGQAQASNWLMLQGTEPTDQSARAKVWGFIQVQYQDDNSDAAPDGTYIAPKLIGPDLESQSTFNVNRARIGVRGTGMPLDSKVNYFMLVELGNNGITSYNDSFAKATDASITLNHLKGARLRAGLFKYPGAEEGLQAIHVFDWINFTQVSNQLLLERFPNKNYTANIPAQTLPPSESLNGFNSSVGAFRDVGIQAFDSFRVGSDKSWDLSYALMAGNGNGLEFSNPDGKYDYYGYLSAEKIFAGKGPFRQGLKMFAWSQTGKRSYDGNNDGENETYDRDRWGIGAKLLKGSYRLTGEYMSGDGVIFVGQNNPSFGLGPGAGKPGAPGNGLDGKADGWYVEGGWKIPKTKFEVDLRYDYFDRLSDDMFEVEFKTWTAGVQYFFNKKTRLALNYAARDFNAPNFADGKGPNAGLDGVDGRTSLQLTAIF